MNYKQKVSLAFLIVGIFLSSSVFALINKDNAADDFIAAAFSSDTFKVRGVSDYLKKKDSVPEKSDSAFLYYQELTKQYDPWIYERIFRPDGMPEKNVLNKWTQDIKISTLWPGDPVQGKFTQTRGGIGWNSGIVHDPKVEALIERQVLSVLPVLKNTTGLDISYLNHSDETDSNFANIRIVYFSSICDGSDNIYKLGDCAFALDERIELFYRMISSLHGHSLSSMVPFTPKSDRQVEGVIFPNENNEIDFAVCFVWKGHPEIVIKGLVTECLVRAMGLPNPISGNDNALSLWNTSKLIKRPNSATINPEDISAIVPVTPSEYDQHILSILYNEKLVSGSSIPEARKNILKFISKGDL